MRVAKFFILVLTVFCAYVLITMRMNQPELTLPDFVAAPAVPASSVATPVPLAVPSATPFTVPVVETVATDSSDEAQMMAEEEPAGAKLARKGQVSSTRTLHE